MRHRLKAMNLYEKRYGRTSLLIAVLQPSRRSTSSITYVYTFLAVGDAYNKDTP